MRHRRFKTFTITIVAVLCLTAVLFAGTALAAENWTRVANGGFGEGAGNTRTRSMAVFGPSIYAGVSNLSGCMVYRSGNGTTWSRVVGQGAGGTTTGPGFGDTNNTDIYCMAVFGNYLYAGTTNTNGCQVWRSTDGAAWTEVVGQGAGGTPTGPGFGDTNNWYACSMAVLGTNLYAGTLNANGCQVWSSSDGTSWSEVVGMGAPGMPNGPGFGDANNSMARSMCVLGSNLYVGTDNINGCQVWRSPGGGVLFSNVVGPGLPGTSGPGFGDAFNRTAMSMCVFGTDLYVGTLNTNPVPTGCDVWRSQDGTTWSRANSSGFGDANNSYAQCMAVHDNNLYVGTVNTSTGCEVWSTLDGSSWSQTNADGFSGNTNKDALCAAVFGSYLYVGTFNDTAGCEIWRDPGVARISSISPVSGQQGQIVFVTVDAYGTAFANGLSQLRFSGSGVSAGWTFVTGTNRLISFVTVAADAPVGMRDVNVVTGSETPVPLTGGFEVVGATPAPPTPPTPAKSTTFYFAEGTCRPNFDPYFCIQNPNDAEAPVTITYMKGDGTNTTQTITVPKSTRTTVRVKDKLGQGDDVSHDFSAKVDSTTGVKIIVERPMYFNYNGVWTGGHDVVGATAPASVFYFAEGTCRPNFDPYICIQNPEATDAQVKITYMKGNGTTDTDTVTVTKNSRTTVRVKQKLGEANDPAHDFSAKVECTTGQLIIAERPMYFDYKGPGNLDWTGGHDVMGITAPASTFYFAEGTCRPTFDPYICIQNPESAAASVTVTYMKGNGTTDTQVVSVGANSRFTIRVKDKLGEANDSAHDFSAKVECTSGQKIIAERPMYFDYKGSGTLDWTGGHDVIGATAPGATFYFAEGTCRPNFDPYICIQNPNAPEVQVKITYMKGDGTSDVQTVTVAGNSRYTVRVKDRLGEANDTAHDFSSRVECTTSKQTIIAERPMYFNYNGVWNGGHDVMGFQE